MLQLELRQVSGNTYYIPSKVNIGMYIEDGEAVLINSGADKETAREILRLLNEFEWQLTLIINTQGVTNHMGGNAFLQEKTGCAIAATQDEASIIENPLLEAALIYGGFPNKELRQKLEVSKASKVTDYLGEEGNVGDSPLTFKFTPGRSLDPISVMTPEKVLFVGEVLLGEDELKNDPLPHLWDIRLQLQTLETLKNIEVDACITSHGDAITDLPALVELNEKCIQNNLNYLLNSCVEPQTIENLVQNYVNEQGIDTNTDLEKHLRITSSIKNYMAYLQDEGLVQMLYIKKGVYWRKN